MKIAHISDLHITGSDFVKEWAENLLELLQEINPEIILITGDLTDEGYSYEYEIAKDFLSQLGGKVQIVVPGNHDARNEGYIVFEHFFGTRFPYYEDENFQILGIDSTEPDIDDGHIGRENYPLIQNKLKAPEKLKILLLHHHLIPIPGTGRERNIPVDAGDVLKICVEAGINFVLSGHKHLPWIWRLENTYFITAGTPTTLRLKGFSCPSFNLLYLEEANNAKVEIINVKDKKPLLSKKLDIKITKQ